MVPTKLRFKNTCSIGFTYFNLHANNSNNSNNNNNATTGKPSHPFANAVFWAVGPISGFFQCFDPSVGAGGCGLPAGPFGLLGATEGLSYLAVLGLVGYQLFRLATNDSKKQSSLVEARFPCPNSTVLNSRDISKVWPSFLCGHI